jgi:hypothetical protein
VIAPKSKKYHSPTDRHQKRHSRSPKTSSQNLRSPSNEKEIATKSKKTSIAYSLLESDRSQTTNSRSHKTPSQNLRSPLHLKIPKAYIHISKMLIAIKREVFDRTLPT